MNSSIDPKLERDLNRSFRRMKKIMRTGRVPSIKPRNAFKIAYQAYRFERQVLGYMWDGLSVEFDQNGPAFNNQMQFARDRSMPMLKAMYGEKLINAANEAYVAVHCMGNVRK